jgi:hypothetical protein
MMGSRAATTDVVVALGRERSVVPSVDFMILIPSNLLPTQ